MRTRLSKKNAVNSMRLQQIQQISNKPQMNSNEPILAFSKTDHGMRENDGSQDFDDMSNVMMSDPL